MGRIARSALVSLAAGSPLLLPAPPAGAQAWPIKDFEVVNVEPAGEVEGWGIFDLWASVMRLSRESGAFDPDLPGYFETVPLDPETRDDIESLLGQSAAVLERSGFPPPALEPVVTRPDGRRAYRVYLVSKLEKAAGEHHWNPCDDLVRDETVILLAADQVIPDGRLGAWGAQTVPHELFHAVQGATPFYRGCGEDGGTAGNWTTEGQAKAVGLDLARLLRGIDLRGIRDDATGLRSYSSRLPVPEYRSTRAYRTSSFWRYLAERASAAGSGNLLSSGFNTVDYTYLARLLERPARGRDCSAAGGACRDEIAWLDEGLQAVLGERLRDVYPRFIQQYARYGSGRYAGLGGAPITWDSGSFDHGCALVELSPPTQVTAPGRPDRGSLQHEDVTGRFEDVSAQCWDIDVQGFDGGGVVVAVTAVGPRTAPRLAGLTAVLADGSERLDTAEVSQPLAGDIPRATWYYALPDGQRTRFLLTNVAYDAEATRPLPALAVTFTALRSMAWMGTGSGGPSAAQIDTPLTIELDWLDGNAFPTPPALGLADHCSLVLRARNTATDDELEVALAHPGRIGPGTYDIAGSDEPEFVPPEDVPGRVTGGFAIGEGNPVADGRAQGFWFHSGAVEITSVSDRLVQGFVRANGWRRRAQGIMHEPFGLARLSVVASFAFVANDRGRLLSSQESAFERSLNASYARTWRRWAHECLQQPDPPLSDGDGFESAPGHTGGPPSGGDPGEEEDEEGQEEGGGEGPSSGPTDPDDPEVGTAPSDLDEDTPSPDATTAAEDADRLEAGGFVDAVTIRVTGGAEATIVLREEELTMTGGCDGRSPISLGFHRGLPTTPDWVGLGFDTADPVATGQTGRFAVGDVRFDLGTVLHRVGGSQVRVPNRFTGPTTLTLTTHDATMAHARAGARRMTGTLRSDGLTNAEGVRVRLEAEFDVHLSCGVEG